MARRGVSARYEKERTVILILSPPHPSSGFQPPEPGPRWSLFTELAGAAERRLVSVLPFAVTHVISYSYWSAAASTLKRRREGNSRRGVVLAQHSGVCGLPNKPGGTSHGHTAWLPSLCVPSWAFAGLLEVGMTVDRSVGSRLLKTPWYVGMLSKFHF